MLVTLLHQGYQDDKNATITYCLKMSLDLSTHIHELAANRGLVVDMIPYHEVISVQKLLTLFTAIP